MSEMNAVAEQYVRLVLAVGQHDATYVDAYYGPGEWRAEVERRSQSLDEIDDEAARLIDEIGPAPAEADLLDALRHPYLVRQLQALRFRVRMLSLQAAGATMPSFDEESAGLYDAVAPVRPETYFQHALDELSDRLPPGGSLVDRYEAFRQAFVIPTDRLSRVFDAAIEECRRRTERYISLPPGECFTVGYVTNKSWSGYNWYQGGYRSLIQVNTDLPIYIDRAVDLACHEGYPGHHVYNALLEHELVRGRGWMEMTVYPLFSPMSLIAEGTANYGIDLTFPDHERVAFERDGLFALAGLDSSRADDYYAVLALTQRLSYAGNEAARGYLNGEIDRATASAWLSRFALMSAARAEQRTRFMDEYRSYVINYNLGQDLVRQYIESRAPAGASGEQSGGEEEDLRAARWRVFADLISSPRLPSNLT
jgi:hypothetical protein